MLALGLPLQADSASDVSRFEGRLVQGTTGTSVAGASLSIVGAAGSVRTGADGRFTWSPAPPIPFHVIVVLPGGQVAGPVAVSALEEGVTTIQIDAVIDEVLTVLGAAPSISAPPGAAMAVLPGTQLARRNPENLTQALETVAGINQVSEGHASVPAIRGLARGRTLLLIDGGRVTAERRVGPSGTFLDPSVIEGIDVARGPGTVAYGSDALGGVVSVRTRRAEPGSPLAARVSGTFGTGIPEARGAFELSKGLRRGGVLVHAHVRNAEDYDGPHGEVFNSGWEDRGFLVNVTHVVAKGLVTAAWQSDFGRDFERPRNNSRTVRFSYPFENSHRVTASYQRPDAAGFRQLMLTGFLGRHEQRTDQDRFATATTGRSIERADVSAHDFHVKGSGERLLGGVRFEFGVDLNGRYGLEALDTIKTFDRAGHLTGDRTNVSIDSARRIDTGVYLQGESAVVPMVRVAGGMRGDRVTTKNVGGFFGDWSTSTAAVSGFGSITLVPVRRLSVTAQLSRGFRDPVLSDRYFRGPSGRGFITGNPHLEPETSLQFDIATRYTVARTQLVGTFYHYRIHDLVERYETQTDFFFFRNRGRARLRGAELEGRTDLGRGYSLEVAAQLARGDALDEEAFLDDVSPATFAVIGRKDFGRRAYAHTRVAFYAEDNRPGPSEIAAPGATLIDLGLGRRLTSQLEIRAVLRNLLDDEYYASADPKFVLAPGRSFSVTAAVEF
jgi:hemoglobin/transferrin/lactoferrin receptor protein